MQFLEDELEDVPYLTVHEALSTILLLDSFDISRDLFLKPLVIV